MVWLSSRFTAVHLTERLTNGTWVARNNEAEAARRRQLGLFTQLEPLDYQALRSTWGLKSFQFTAFIYCTAGRRMKLFSACDFGIQGF